GGGRGEGDGYERERGGQGPLAGTTVHSFSYRSPAGLGKGGPVLSLAHGRGARVAGPPVGGPAGPGPGGDRLPPPPRAGSPPPRPCRAAGGAGHLVRDLLGRGGNRARRDGEPRGARPAGRAGSAAGPEVDSRRPRRGR